MVEGNGKNNKSNQNFDVKGQSAQHFNEKIDKFELKAPVKKFYRDKQQQQPPPLLQEDEMPSIPPRPLLGPKLPLRSDKISSSKSEIKTKNSFPLEDNIYTGLKPLTLAIIPALPADFSPKVFMSKIETVFGLQHGRIVTLNQSAIGSQHLNDSSNRQFYELIPFKQPNETNFLAFQDTGTIFKVSPNPKELKITVLLRDAIPMGSFCKFLQRPEVDELWVVGLRETSILLLNSRDAEVALIKRTPTHFPEALSVSFLGPEELAVTRSDRSVQIFAVGRHSHQPALIAKLPSTIGDLVKVLKIPEACGRFKNTASFGTIYADGKMIIWKFEDANLTEKITIQLTLFRIQSVHVPERFSIDKILWIGLSNGKLLLIQLQNADVIILAEAKYHQSALTKFIPCDQSILTVDSSGQMYKWDESFTIYKQNGKMWEREADYCKYERVSVRICSWNVAAQNPNECSDSVAAKWLGFEEENDSDMMTDLLVINLQEIVDLNAKSFIGGNNSLTNELKGVERWIKFIQGKVTKNYKLVHSSEMVGLALIVFCRDGLKGELSSVAGGSIKTGLGGLHGNKGALFWRTFIHDCPIVFVACHLAAGQNGVLERNSDAATILRTASLPEATSSRKDPFAYFTGNDGTRIFDHSAIFFAGDLNYRIDLDRTDCINLISKGDFEGMRFADQLGKQMNKKELILSYFKEMELGFSPTYKYDRGSIDKFDSSEKGRVPAWCDRILFYDKQKDNPIIQPRSYNSIPEATLSDHKPIHATFEIKCRKIDHQAREHIFRNFGGKV